MWSRSRRRRNADKNTTSVAITTGNNNDNYNYNYMGCPYKTIHSVTQQGQRQVSTRFMSDAHKCPLGRNKESPWLAQSGHIGNRINLALRELLPFHKARQRCHLVANYTQGFSA